jgi:hypothetical protein
MRADVAPFQVAEKSGIDSRLLLLRWHARGGRSEKNNRKRDGG